MGPKPEVKAEPVRRTEAKRAALSRSVGQLARLHWYAVMVRGGTEFAVEALLERRGFVALVPLRTEYRRVNRYVQRKREVSFPLVVRYVFVGFEPAQLGRDSAPPWHRVFSISMVQAVVGADDRPWRMRGKETAEFLKEHARHVAPKEQQHMRTHREFAAGDLVRVVEGSLAGMEITVHRIVGTEARVLMPLFGKDEQELPIPLANLEPAD